jgi:hypothetical protein
LLFYLLRRFYFPPSIANYFVRNISIPFHEANSYASIYSFHRLISPSLATSSICPKRFRGTLVLILNVDHDGLDVNITNVCPFGTRKIRLQGSIRGLKGLTCHHRIVKGSRFLHGKHGHADMVKRSSF